jgi:pimeloyl-ACP methyl ester carboxylesterase
MLYEGTFPTGSVDLNYVAATEVGPSLLFLHGITSHWQSSFPVMPAFALRWQLYALDLRGHGRSGRAAGAYRIVDYAADVVAFLRGRVTRPTVIVGHSLGAIIALAVASDAPELVRALVLEDPPLGPFWDQSARERPEFARFSATLALLREQPSLADVTRHLTDTRPELDAARRRIVALSLYHLDPDVLESVVTDRVKEGYNLDARFPRITAPTLLLQGNETRGGALEDSRAQRAASLLRDCAHVYFPEAGHGIKDARQLEYCKIVGGFLESV